LTSLTMALSVSAAAVPASRTALLANSVSEPRLDLNQNTKRHIWQPAVGSGWQIEIDHTLTNTALNVPVYIIDLFDNSATTIASLHQLGRKVICYFSAGTYEDWRPDASSFKSSDFGNPLDDWPGERWLNTKSTYVQNIMKARLSLAASKGCDGVDPDNVDGYGNDNGLGLTTADAVSYVKFLVNGAHASGLSIGLRNAAEIVPDVVDLMQWAVNEQCAEYDECDAFQDFIHAGKPVFHIEYPSGAPYVRQATNSQICEGPGATGFSTVMKKMNLDDWVMAC